MIVRWSFLHFAGRRRLTVSRESVKENFARDAHFLIRIPEISSFIILVRVRVQQTTYITHHRHRRYQFPITEIQPTCKPFVPVVRQH